MYRGRRAALLLGVCLGLFLSTPVGASLIIMVGNVSTSSPSSSNTLEVNLVNTGPAPVSLAGFSFEIAVADPHITFTSATIATVATYVFAGNSLLGPEINTSTGQTLDVVDFWSGAGGATVAAGATVGLGHVSFDVPAGGTPGIVTVTLSPFPATSLMDAAGGNLIVDALTSGSITITGTAVEEPGTLALLALCIVGLAVPRRRTLN